MVKIEPTVPASEYIKLMDQCRRGTEIITQLTTSLTEATQKLKTQADLIKTLSEQNLALVARIESITAITCPNKDTFAA